jgi:hypothetical protein
MPSEPSKLLIRHRKNKDESAEDRIRKDARSERARLEFDWPDVEKRKAEKRAIKESEKRARDQELGRTNPDEHAEIGGTGKHINFWAGLEKDVSDATRLRVICTAADMTLLSGIPIDSLDTRCSHAQQAQAHSGSNPGR